jgi:hypothetical protein
MEKIFDQSDPKTLRPSPESIIELHNPVSVVDKSHPLFRLPSRLWKCGLLFVGEHIPINRAWILIQEASRLSGAEAEHVETCGDCRKFLRSFVSVARYLGFSVRFPSQEYRLDDEHAA